MKSMLGEVGPLSEAGGFSEGPPNRSNKFELLDWLGGGLSWAISIKFNGSVLGLMGSSQPTSKISTGFLGFSSTLVGDGF